MLTLAGNVFQNVLSVDLQVKNTCKCGILTPMWGEAWGSYQETPRQKIGD